MNPGHISALFTSVGDMAEKTGFEMDFCQLEAGEPILKTNTTFLPSIISTEFYFNKAIHQRGKAPDGYLTFGVPQGDSSFRWMGKEIGSGYLFDFNARSGFDVKSERNFSAKTIHVKVDRMHDTADIHGIDLSDVGKTDYAVPKLVDAVKLHQLQDAILNVENLVSNFGHQPLGKVDISTAEDAVYRKLADCLDFSQRNFPISHSNRLAIKRRAIDYIQLHYCETITITDICHACATTNRTLVRVFREEFGVTPKQYLSLVRLSSVRRELCQKDLEKSIRDIAISKGFWHMSQFAQDYKNQFGELPSQSRL